MSKFSLSRIILTFFLLFLVLNFSPFNFSKTNDEFFNNKTICKALVESVINSDSDQNSRVKVLVSEGKYKNKEFTLDNSLVVNDRELILRPNDYVQISISDDINGELNVKMYNYIRTKHIFFLVSFFILLVIVIAGIKGLYAVLSIAFNISVIYMILLPGLLSGYSPIALTIICCLIISFSSLIIQNGLNKKTISCLIGTLGGVIIAGLVTYVMSNSLQVSIKNEDVIGTMTNTLILAYVGSSMVTLMIFLGYNINFSYLINLQDISVEILRSLAGSIGIILSVPITIFARACMD